MKNRMRIYVSTALMAAFLVLGLSMANVGHVSAQSQQGNAQFLPMAANHLVKVVTNSAGIPVLGQSSMVESTTGTSYPTLKGALTTTAATTDAVTITGLVSTSSCVLSPTNASAATNIATTYISATAANTLTVTHVATGSMTYNILCSSS